MTPGRVASSFQVWTAAAEAGMLSAGCAICRLWLTDRTADNDREGACTGMTPEICATVACWEKAGKAKKEIRMQRTGWQRINTPKNLRAEYHVPKPVSTAWLTVDLSYLSSVDGTTVASL